MAYPYYNNYSFYPQQQQRFVPQQQTQQQATQMTQIPQIQQTGFVLVSSEQEAKNYPVAPGNSVTFKDETKPYCYVKTMGFSPFEEPTFEKYRLVKEDTPTIENNTPTGAEKGGDNNNISYATKDDLTPLYDEIDRLKKQIERKTAKTKKIIEIGDDDDDE